MRSVELSTHFFSWERPKCFSDYNHNRKKISSNKLLTIITHKFKTFPCFWLVKTTHINHHNELLLTKFAKNFKMSHLTNDIKVRPTANYWTIDVKMTSRGQPVSDYWTIDWENLGMRLCFLTNSEMVACKFKSLREQNILNIELEWEQDSPYPYVKPILVGRRQRQGCLRALRDELWSWFISADAFFLPHTITCAN